MALVNIEYGSLASSEIMNKNFIYLDDKIAESSESIMTSISSILSNIATINTRLNDISENITDSIISPLLFTYIFGLPGALTVRVINTLDAMVGYKNEENILIGWFPANLDDIINSAKKEVEDIMKQNF